MGAAGGGRDVDTVKVMVVVVVVVNVVAVSECASRMCWKGCQAHCLCRMLEHCFWSRRDLRVFGDQTIFGDQIILGILFGDWILLGDEIYCLDSRGTGVQRKMGMFDPCGLKGIFVQGSSRGPALR